MSNIKAKLSRKIWGFDSEFLQSGRVNEPADIQTIQFSDGTSENTFVLESADELKQWLYNHRKIKVIYAFVALPDLASLSSWLGDDHGTREGKKHVIITKYRGHTYGVISYRGFHCKVFDARPLLNNFNLPRLEDCGRWVDLPKLDKPGWLGQRKWQNTTEYEHFKQYAAADAIITSRAVRKLIEKFGADPAIYASAGTLAKHEFSLPQRLEMRKNTVVISSLESSIKRDNYAGRSEAFVAGYTPNAIYLDVKSLYPTSVVATRALQITDAVPCQPEEIVIDDAQRFGWLAGTFESSNDLWGLPIRARNNTYATGEIFGLFHSFDLAAAKVKVHRITRAYKPVFGDDRTVHEKYANLLLKRLEGSMTEDQKMYAKAVLNALTGKLGQAKPHLATTSNFYAYNTILAHSHYTLSKLFDSCNAPILGTDTDSIFTTSDISGKKFEVTDGEHNIPIVLDVKGLGDLVYFRSKVYMLLTRDQQDQLRENKKIDKPVYGHHGWVYFKEDFFKLFFGDVNTLNTRKDIKHSLDTQVLAAKKLELGRWLTEPVTLDSMKIRHLLETDRKRRRETYDSYDLVMQGRSMPSRAWSIDEMMLMPDNSYLDYPKNAVTN